MSYNRIKSDKTNPTPVQETAAKYTGPVERPDGRRKPKERTKQFNPRVRPQFLEQFAQAQAEEAERLGENVTQAYFLELLLANWLRVRGQEEIKPFGLSEPAFDVVKAIADHMGWSLSDVVEDAIAGRFRRFRIENPATKAS